MRRGAIILATALAAVLWADAGAFAAEDDGQQPLTDRRPTVGSAIATPAEDLNIKKTAIPESLQKAAANPYDVAGTQDCTAIASEIASLDQALGPDRDAPPEPDDRSGLPVADVLKAGVAAVIPYRGVIRQVSGANAHEKTISQAVQVGFARRGFLKGRAIEMNCPPPASPAGYQPVPRLASAPIDVPPAPPPAPQLAAAPIDVPAPPAAAPQLAAEPVDAPPPSLPTPEIATTAPDTPPPSAPAVEPVLAPADPAPPAPPPPSEAPAPAAGQTAGT